MQIAGASPGLSASAPCMRNASVSRPENSLALSSVKGDLGISADAPQKCCPFGPRGAVARRDVLAATDADVYLADDYVFVARVAFR